MAEPLYMGGPSGAENIFLQELPSSLGATLKATAGQVFETNPVTHLYQWLSREEVDDFDRAGGRVGSPTVSAEEARARAEQDKLKLTIPDKGIRESALNDLIERKYQERVRQDTLARGPSGFIPGVARFLTGAAVSMLDPLNIASAFIPVVGAARYAKMLEAAGEGALARAAVRAKVGAIEGAVGAAVLEPLVYGLAQNLQKDYTAADSFMNIAFGTVLGGGLHVGAGAVRDWVGAGRAIETTPPRGSTAETVARMTPEQRMDVARVALAQAIEGRAIDVEPMITVYHGSNAVFEQIDLSKMGSGEGAQSFSYGAYMAENSSVAGRYGGNLYKGEIPQRVVDNMLDWDAEWKDQPGNVKAAEPELLTRINELRKENGIGEPWSEIPAFLKGADLAVMLGAKDISSAGAFNLRMQELGIPGVKYLDQGSRDAGAGSRNYVLFNESDVRMTERNGQPIQQLAARSNSPEARINPEDAKASKEAEVSVNEAKATDAQSQVEIEQKSLADNERELKDMLKATESQADFGKMFEAEDQRIADTETLNKAMAALAKCQLRNP